MTGFHWLVIWKTVSQWSHNNILQWLSRVDWHTKIPLRILGFVVLAVQVLCNSDRPTPAVMLYCTYNYTGGPNLACGARVWHPCFRGTSSPFCWALPVLLLRLFSGCKVFSPASCSAFRSAYLSSHKGDCRCSPCQQEVKQDACQQQGQRGLAASTRCQLSAPWGRRLLGADVPRMETHTHARW